MISDANKSIFVIAYNHMNLPVSIAVTKKGTIQYTYDATGNRTRKVVIDTDIINRITDYVSGVVYQDKVLQFLGHEEGWIRLEPTKENKAAVTSLIIS